MGELGRLVEAYRDSTDPRVSDAWIGRKVGVYRSAVGPWLSGQSMPKAAHLRKLAGVIGQPYDRVLEAALVDAGYLLKESVGNAQHPAATTTAGESPAERVTEQVADEEPEILAPGPAADDRPPERGRRRKRQA